jgi:hypothetical protein
MRKPNLYEHTFEDIHLFYSEDAFSDEDEDVKPTNTELIGEIADSTFSVMIAAQTEYKEMTELYMKKMKLEKKAMLIAHGNDIDEKWVFTDGRNEFPVQGWINVNDGVYGLLVLCCCNPEGRQIHSRKSAVLVPNNIYSPLLQRTVGVSASDSLQVELYIPKIGYIDSYSIAYELEKMRKKESENKICRMP